MTKKEPKEYKVITNGTPDYSKIPEPLMEVIAKKFLDDILKQKAEDDAKKKEESQAIQDNYDK